MATYSSSTPSTPSRDTTVDFQNTDVLRGTHGDQSRNPATGVLSCCDGGVSSSSTDYVSIISMRLSETADRLTWYPAANCAIFSGLVRLRSVSNALAFNSAASGKGTTFAD